MSTERIVYTNPETGVAAIFVPAPGLTAKDCLQALPIVEKTEEEVDVDGNGLGTYRKYTGVVDHEVVADTDIPTDRTFRDAWEHDTTEAPEKIKCCMEKACAISHDKRRAKRKETMTPLDIESTIPQYASGAEKKRQDVRDADAIVQINIDNATTEAELKQILEDYEAI